MRALTQLTIKQLRTLLHPISVFVIAQISWGLLMFVWIRWYVMRSREVDDRIHGLVSADRWAAGNSIILIEGCILMGIILIGFYLIFVSLRRQVALNKLQRSILDSVTHELKTPLASVRLHTETLMMRTMSDSARLHFLQKSLGEIERLQRLIDELLLSARLEVATGTSEFQQGDAVAIIEDSWNKLCDRMQGRRIFCYTKSPTVDEFRINLNQQQLTMAFDNIFNNAAKYTNEGGTIKLSIHTSNDHLRISLTDDGCGIDKKDLKKIFRKFYRVESKKTHPISGSGLGLFVCESVLRAHEGKVYATSNGFNTGSTFYVELTRPHSSRRR